MQTFCFAKTEKALHTLLPAIRFLTQVVVFNCYLLYRKTEKSYTLKMFTQMIILSAKSISKCARKSALLM